MSKKVVPLQEGYQPRVEARDIKAGYQPQVKLPLKPQNLVAPKGGSAIQPPKSAKTGK